MSWWDPRRKRRGIETKTRPLLLVLLPLLLSSFPTPRARPASRPGEPSTPKGGGSLSRSGSRQRRCGGQLAGVEEAEAEEFLLLRRRRRRRRPLPLPLLFLSPSPFLQQAGSPTSRRTRCSASTSAARSTLRGSTLPGRQRGWQSWSLFLPRPKLPLLLLLLRLLLR